MLFATQNQLNSRKISADGIFNIAKGLLFHTNTPSVTVQNHVLHSYENAQKLYILHNFAHCCKAVILTAWDY